MSRRRGRRRARERRLSKCGGPAMQQWALDLIFRNVTLDRRLFHLDVGLPRCSDSEAQLEVDVRRGRS